MLDKDQPVAQIHHADRERAIAALAAAQCGRVTRAQLLEVGLSPTAIRHRVRAGRYVREYAGVFAIAPRRPDLPGLAWAAVLACGLGAVASHLTAAALWDFVRHFGRPLHVTAPTCHSRPGIVTHRSRLLTARAQVGPHPGGFHPDLTHPDVTHPDLTHQRSVPVTTRARTLLDIAPLLPPEQLRRIVNDHARSGALRLPAVRDVLARAPRHPGVGTLAAILADTRHGLTRSGLEDEFLQFVTRHDLPLPVLNRTVNGIEVDVYYPEHDLIVEIDGREYHEDPAAFERDRERDAVHLAHGTPTLRITAERLEGDPRREADRLRAILEARAARPPARSATTEAPATAKAKATAEAKAEAKAPAQATAKAKVPATAKAEAEAEAKAKAKATPAPAPPDASPHPI